MSNPKLLVERRKTAALDPRTKHKPRPARVVASRTKRIA